MSATARPPLTAEPATLVLADPQRAFVELLSGWLEAHTELRIVGTASTRAAAAALVQTVRPRVVVVDPRGLIGSLQPLLKLSPVRLQQTFRTVLSDAVPDR